MRLLTAVLFFLPLPARAWNAHWLLTRAALEKLPLLDAEGRVETLSDYLKASAFSGSEKDFLISLKLNQAAALPFSLGESAGSTVSLRRVLEYYSDEPDWALDDNLFEQYPELWKDDYRYMGGGKGSLSRVFRHLYWPGGFYREPKPPSTEPVLDPAVLGEAPERAQLFFDLSRKAFQAGQPYWGARFLGWALHYLEDMTMPFHAVQLPALEFIRTKPDGTADLEATTRLVVYHHLAIDNYPTRALEGSVGEDSLKRISAALSGEDAGDFPGARELCAETAKAAARQAGRLGKRALDFFPEMTEEDGKDPVKRVFNPKYWEEVAARQKDNPRETEAFVAMLEKALKPAGSAVRAFVGNAIKPEPGAAPAPSTLPRDSSWAERRLDEFGRQAGAHN